MNVLENLLVTLMEECSEVAKAASKILRAGPGSTINGTRSTTNLQELQAELDDLQGVLMELRANGLDVVVRNPAAVVKKREKLRHYIGVSRQLGFVQGPLAAGESLVDAPYVSGAREELIHRLLNAGNFSLDYLKGLTDFELVSLGKGVRLSFGKWLELAKDACQKCGSVVPGAHMAHCEEAQR